MTTLMSHTFARIVGSFFRLKTNNHYVKTILAFAKGQTKSKRFFQADVSSKKRTNEFNFTTMRLVFARFLEEIEDAKKTFRN